MSAARLRQLFAFIVTLTLLIGLVPPAPASAYDGTDRAASPHTGWTTGCNNAGGSPCDNNDATFTGPNHFNGSPTVGRLATQFSRTGYPTACAVAVCTFSILSFRLVLGLCTSGWPYPGGACGTGGTANTVSRLTIMCTPSYQNGDYDAQYVVYDDTSPPGFHGGADTGQVNFDEPCVITALNDNSTNRIWIRATLTNGSGETLFYTTNFFDEAGILVGDHLDYIYGVVCSSTLFSKTCSWAWAQSYTGTWGVRRDREDPSDVTVLKTGTDPVETDLGATCLTVDNCERFFSDPCGITGCSGWVIYGLDTGTSTSWSYAIPHDADGVLIDEDPPIGISGVVGCYNANYEQCGTGQLASTVRLTYSIRPSGQADNVVVQIGPQYLFGPGFDGNAWYTDTVPGGAHTITMTSETPYPVAGQNLLIVATGPRNAVQVVYGIDWVDGGASAPIVIEDPDAPLGDQLEDCAFTDVGCFTRNLGDIFGSALASIFGGVEDVWTNALNGLSELAMSREPFASVIRSSTAFTEQLSDFNDETSATDDCPGLVIAVPLDAFPGMNYDGDNPEWTVLDCATFEPLTSTTWYPTLRAAMDPFIYVFFAYGQLRRLQPKPSL